MRIDNATQQTPPAPPIALSRRFAFALIFGVVLLNLIIVAIGIQSLAYSRTRTVDQVRDSTANLATLLEQNNRTLPNPPGASTSPCSTSPTNWSASSPKAVPMAAPSSARSSFRTSASRKSMLSGSARRTVSSAGARASIRRHRPIMPTAPSSPNTGRPPGSG